MVGGFKVGMGTYMYVKSAMGECGRGVKPWPMQCSGWSTEVNSGEVKTESHMTRSDQCMISVWVGVIIPVTKPLKRISSDTPDLDWNH